MFRRCLVLAILVAAACQGGDPLSQIDQETVTISGSTAFGTITVGQTSGSTSIVVAPAGGAQDDTLDSISESCPDFDVVADNLPAPIVRTLDCSCQTCRSTTCVTDVYETYTFTAAFHPSVGGPQSCVLTLHIDNDTANRTITLTGTGQVPPIQIDVQPPSVAFGDVRVGGTSTQATVGVGNLGGETMSVSSASVSAGYTLVGPTTFDVAPASSVQLGISCSPGAEGSMPGALSIASNDPNTPNLDVPLSCNGVQSNLAIDPSPVTLTTTRVGIAVAASITLTNEGTASTTIMSVAVDGPGMTITSDPSGNDIAAGGTAAVGVGFDAAAHGDASGTLTIATSDGTRTAQVTARAVQPAISIAPDGSVDFGPVCVGQMATQMFTVLDVGDGAFAISNLSTPDAPFTSVFDGPMTVLASGANQATFHVTAAPTVPAVATSSITLSSDIENDPPHQITLSVTGLPAGTTATPAMLDLGSNPIETTTVGQTITLTNCNPAAIDFTNARIEGGDTDTFTIVQAPPTSSIASTGAAQWLVVFDAHTTGAKMSQFLVDYPGGTATVDLLGEGLAPPVDPVPGGDEHSYYTCSAGGGSAAWPLGLAVLALRRRRRAS